MECPSCGGETPEDKKFCTRCGALLPAAVCPVCRGVSPPGSRFCADCGAGLAGGADASDAPAAAPGPAAAAAPRPSALPALRRPEAERRQLTVMFSDLVGSTALAARLDPEDLREVIRDYHQCVTDVVERFEGHVAKYLGDGVLAYFGYPKAHEDAAERAVRAGLGIVDAVGRLEPLGGLRLRVRVGIATGLVVVGDLFGAGATEEQVAVGGTPNLAARLQAIAEPNSVVIAEGTRRLIGGLFVGADLGVHRLDGFAEPVRAWRVLRASAAEGRFAAQHAAGLPPLVGREQELALLLDRWERAKEGEGQVVLLAGEPGIGKSHVTEALRQRLEGEPHVRFRCTCSPFHANSALHPVIDHLERAAGFHRDDTAEAKLDKLEALLAQATDDVAAVAPLFADLLAIPTGGRYPPLDLTPQRRKDKVFAALLIQLEGLAAKQPLLQVFEDVQWIDPTSLELLGLVVDRVQRLPVLEVITFRPEFGPPWSGYGHVTLLTLNRLGRRHVAAMIERATDGKALPAEVEEQIVAKTDGVPLFVEELTKAVLESGLLKEEGDRYALTGPLPPLAIPATLHDSLMARLDRLAPVKEVAQIGAAIGREFPYELLAAVAPLDEAGLREALDRLVEAELVFRRGTPPEATYSFKHALVRDAAYESLLTSKRQRLHARIAGALEERFPHTAEIEPELLARHYSEAGLAEEAVGYWHRAGQRASERSARTEAVAHLTKGLELVESLPESRGRARRELALHLALGPVLMGTRGWSAPEVEHAYLRARDLCREVDDEPGQLFAATWGLWLVYQQRALLETTRGLVADLFALAERQPDDPGLLLQAHHAACVTSFALAEPERGRHHAEQGIALYDLGRHHGHTFVYGGHDPGVCCRYNLAAILWLLGHPDRALATAHEAIGLARRIAHPVSLALALTFTSFLHQYRREPRLAQGCADEAEGLCVEQGMAPHCAAPGVIVRGWAAALQGRPGEGIAEILRGLEAMQAMGVSLRRPYYLGLLAEAHGQAGQHDEGLGALAEGIGMAGETGERWWEAELYRLKGELLLARAGDTDCGEAEACFHRAIEIARKQGAKSLELRAALSLGRLWRDRGRRAEAHELLAPIRAGFSNDFDTADVAEAEALLDAAPR